MNLKLIELLKQSRTLSGASLARQSGISRQALNKQIHTLRKHGAKIEGTPGSGYKWIAESDLLMEEEVALALKTKKFGRPTQIFAQLDSTQTRAKTLAGLGGKEGTVVLAEKQTSGRGRLNREWHSADGGLWFSILLRPAIQPSQVPQLPLIFSIAVADALEKTGAVTCKLKWPNDVWLAPKKPKSKFKKVCGILSEMSAESDKVNWLVTGIGINVNNKIPPALRKQAISLHEALGHKANRSELLVNLLERMEKTYEDFLKNGFNSLRKTYLHRSLLTGKRVTVTELTRTYTGIAESIAPDGSLLIRDKTHKLRAVLAGDITLSSSPLPVRRRGETGDDQGGGENQNPSNISHPPNTPAPNTPR